MFCNTLLDCLERLDETLPRVVSGLRTEPCTAVLRGEVEEDEEANARGVRLVAPTISTSSWLVAVLDEVDMVPLLRREGNLALLYEEVALLVVSLITNLSVQAIKGQHASRGSRGHPVDV